MEIRRYWPLGILLLAWAGCSGVVPASTRQDKSAADWIASGNEALAKNELDQALDAFTHAIAAQPDSAAALERRAATYLQSKNYDLALSDCDSALRIDDKLASAYFVRGEVEKQQNHKEKAVDDFTKALENSLERVDVLTERGATYRSLAKARMNPDEAAKLLQKAAADFDRAVKIDPKQPGLRLQRAMVGLETGDYAAAVADCDAAIQAEPGMVEAFVCRARGYCELGEYDRAVTDCDAAIHLDPNCTEAYVQRARARLERAAEMRTVEEVAECSQAVDDCQKAIELAKKIKGDTEGMNRARSLRGRAHELRGLTYHSLGVAKRALDEYGQALTQDPYLVSALLRRADTRSSLQDYAGALNDCNTAISLDSARPDAYSGRGTVYFWESEFDKAIDDFTQAVQLDPRCAKAFYGRALVYSQKATLAAAKATLAAQQMAAAKTEAERQSSMAACNASRNESLQLWKRDIEDTSEAIKINRRMAKAYLARGAAYGKLGIADKALADFNSAIREDPKDLYGYKNRAVLFFKVRRYDAAIADLLEVEKLAPESPQISNFLFQCYREKNDPILTAKYYKQFQDRVQRLKKAEQEILLGDSDFIAGPKVAKVLPDVRPDSELDPLQKAKDDLKNKLEATAEQ
jgi:tetratricopeptide (TPR) repeat protein